MILLVEWFVLTDARKLRFLFSLKEKNDANAEC